MALTLIKETGAGLADANAYADAADGDAYHEGHCYASAWTGAVAADKERALVMATRLIDVSYQFNGFRKTNSQTLQWPREGAVDPDRKEIQVSPLDNQAGRFFDSDKVPSLLIEATCELARELLVADRTAAPDGEGLASFSVAGALTFTFDKAARRPVLPALVQTMLAKLGTQLNPRAGSVPLMRC
jgi:hypothetical protein